MKDDLSKRLCSFLSRKVYFTHAGIALTILWQVKGWDEKLLWVALGFVGSYTVSNVVQKFNGGK